MFSISVQAERLWSTGVRFLGWLVGLPSAGLHRLTETDEVLDWYFVQMESDLLSALHSTWDKPEAKDVVRAIAAVAHTKNQLGIGRHRYRGQETAWRVVDRDFDRAVTLSGKLTRQEPTTDKIQEFVVALGNAQSSVGSYLRARDRKV